MRLFSILALALFLVVGCSDPVSVDTEAPVAESGRFTPPNPATKNLKISEIVASVVATQGEFEVLLAALQATGLDAAVDGRTIFTVVAPTDQAFHDIGLTKYNVGDLDTAFLTNVLLYHVKGGRFTAEIVLQQSALTMANGGTLKVDAGAPGFVDANGRSAGIVATDIAARNGIIHVIDTVVLP